MAFIRPYKPSDFEGMSHICRETLNPALRPSVPGRRLAPYCWTHQYTHLSPTTCFVLDDGNGRPVGYCVGCPDIPAFVAAYDSYTKEVLDKSPEVTRPDDLELKEPLFNEDGSINEVFLSRLAYNPHLLILDGNDDLLAEYKATMHIDLLDEFQGQGWGKQLISLGDVVVSQPRNGYGGVVQYDFGKTRPGEFETTGFLNTPPIVLLDALSKIQADHLSGNSKFSQYLQRITHQLGVIPDDPRTDTLFESSYEHVEGPTCENCDDKQLVYRKPRNQDTVIHYGTVASGNQVIRDGITRDRLSSKLGGILCFEMEAAGLMNSFPCLVIRGICDYADSHKNKAWQPYAASATASYAREVLAAVNSDRPSMAHIVDDTTKTV